MSKITSVNNTPSTGAEAIFILKETMKAAGWTVTQSSDGSTYNNSGDQIASPSDLANNNAWFVIQDPGGRRQFCFQRGTSNVAWRILVSEEAKFSGGSPSATRVPDASDQGTLFGSGTNASPTFATYFNTDGSYRCHAIVFNTPCPGTDVYSVFFFASDSSNGLCRTLFFIDGLKDFHPLDTSPMGMIVGYNTTTWSLSNSFNVNTLGSNIIKKYLKNTTFSNVRLMIINRWQGSSEGVFPNNGTTYRVSPSVWDSGREVIYKIAGLFTTASDNTSTYGFHGFFQRIGLSGNFERQYPDTINLYTDAHVYAGSYFIIPWEDGTAALL